MSAATILDMSDREYRTIPALSGSGVSRLLTNPRTFTEPVEVSEAMRIGTAFHARVLGSDLPIESSGKWATLGGAAAKAWVAEVDAGGGMVTLEAWEPRLAAMEAALDRNPEAVRLLYGKGGVNEQAIVSDWNGVPVKGKPDRVLTFAEGLVVVDLKSSRDPYADKSIYDYGYDRQVFFYERLACEAHGIEPAMPPSIVSVGSTAPHGCVVWQFTEYERAAAYADIDRALELYATCMERDEWPDWAEQGPQSPHLPVWIERARDNDQDAAAAWLEA